MSDVWNRRGYVPTQNPGPMPVTVRPASDDISGVYVVGYERGWSISRISTGWEWHANAFGAMTHGQADTEAEAQTAAIREADRLAAQGKRQRRLISEGFQ